MACGLVSAARWIVPRDKEHPLTGPTSATQVTVPDELHWWPVRGLFALLWTGLCPRVSWGQYSARHAIRICGFCCLGLRVYCIAGRYVWTLPCNGRTVPCQRLRQFVGRFAVPWAYPIISHCGISCYRQSLSHNPTSLTQQEDWKPLLSKRLRSLPSSSTSSCAHHVQSRPCKSGQGQHQLPAPLEISPWLNAPCELPLQVPQAQGRQRIEGTVLPCTR